jgi:hypothetical protein
VVSVVLLACMCGEFDKGWLTSLEILATFDLESVWMRITLL